MKLESAAPAQAVPARGVSRGLWPTLYRRLRQDRVAQFCLLLLVMIILAAILAPWVAPADPLKTSMLSRLKPPGTAGYLLGTDELGRDMLSRLLYGGRYSLFMGIVPVVLATLLGGMLGLCAGYAGGRVNTRIMRALDVFFAFPSILLAVAISGALGPGIGNSLITLTVIFIAPIARVTESATTALMSLEFVTAARASGASGWQIIKGHLISNIAGPVLIFASSLVSISIVIAAGLSFIGLGATPPTPEWGVMLSTLRQAIYVAPVNAILPGVLLFATSFCFNILSDTVRAALDTKV
ncbi:ABC transporter permease subunit [Bordetella petrii]|nr:ABC transporter permease subunit [Bordetella petrii]